MNQNILCESDNLYIFPPPSLSFGIFKNEATFIPLGVKELNSLNSNENEIIVFLIPVKEMNKNHQTNTLKGKVILNYYFIILLLKLCFFDYIYPNHIQK